MAVEERKLGEGYEGISYWKCDGLRIFNRYVEITILKKNKTITDAEAATAAVELLEKLINNVEWKD